MAYNFWSHWHNGHFLKYVLVGVLNAAVCYISFAALVLLGLHYVPASLVSYGLGVGNSYAWNKYFTFRQAKTRWTEMAKFFGVYVVQYLVGLSLLAALVETGRVHPMVAQGIVLPVVVAFSFLAQKYWTFRSQLDGRVSHSSELSTMGNHILDNVRAWDFFRKLLDIFFGMYRKWAVEIRKAGIDRTVSLLDVGCGTGQYSQLTGGYYLGIDNDPRYIAQAQQKYGSPNKQFICQRLQDFDFQGRTFDVTLLACVLHHIPEEDVRPLLGALAKVTTKYLVVFDPTHQSRHNYIGRFLTAHDRGRFIRSREQEISLIAEYFTVTRAVPAKIFFTEGVGVFAQPKNHLPTR